MLFTSQSLSVYELFDQAKKYKKNNNISWKLNDNLYFENIPPRHEKIK